MDYHLPGMSGVELLRAHARHSGRRSAAVMLTGSGSERVAVDAMKAGAQDYLLKDDLSPERLRHSLRRAVDTVRRARAGGAPPRTERAERAARRPWPCATSCSPWPPMTSRGRFKSWPSMRRCSAAASPRHLTPHAESRLDTSSARVPDGRLIDHFLQMTRGQQRPFAASRWTCARWWRAKVRELESSGSRRR